VRLARREIVRVHGSEKSPSDSPPRWGPRAPFDEGGQHLGRRALPTAGNGRAASTRADERGSHGSLVALGERTPDIPAQESPIPLRPNVLLLGPILALATACLVGDAPRDSCADMDSNQTAALGALRSSAAGTIDVACGAKGWVRSVSGAHGASFGMAGPSAVEAARAFLAAHHDVFRLSAADAAEFVPGRVDRDPDTGVTHVTLNRTKDGVAAFHGGITIHLDRRNDPFSVVCDDRYGIDAPVNTIALDPTQAIARAGDIVGLPGLVPHLDGDGHYVDVRALGPIDVRPQLFRVGKNDTRRAYQVTLAWKSDEGMRAHIIVLDAADGSVLLEHSILTSFQGKVFTAAPALDRSDSRVVVSFDGDPAASPAGWVDSTRSTRGNNVFACTDRDGNNVFQSEFETQPSADGYGTFDFPWDGHKDSVQFAEAAVVDAFYLVNDFHDRTYKLGFTESAGNFQRDNFGKGGNANDMVLVDSIDGGGVNNSDFFTPPDGLPGRMNLYLWTRSSSDGVTEGADFDPSIVYHEATHGMSHRLVGGGATTCLQGRQSGALGEGWSDFMAGSFLNDPVVGRYVSGGAPAGIRRLPMDTSIFTYADIQSGNLAEIHDMGEVWAATLFDLRERVGAPVAEQLVVDGMKQTPCNPTFLDARFGILIANAILNEQHKGVSECVLWEIFGRRGMGFSATSSSDNSTADIVTASDADPNCDPSDPATRP